MIDIHTHLLPKVDDGSESITETKEILSNMKMQGVSRIYATPHFYAENEDPEAFLERRNKAFDVLTDVITEYDVRLGAEVHYYHGMGHTEEMDQLLLENTRFLLLEMPTKQFGPNIIDDLMNLRYRDIIPIIAHLNRYKEFLDDGFINFCNAQGIKIQLNTECIVERIHRKRAIHLIEEKKVHFLATDCHGINHRRPNLKDAFDIVRKCTSKRMVDDFICNEERIIDA